jgi:putative hydrolase of the HAD superfamily
LNLIFDLGGVVVRWDPAAIIASVFDDEELQAKVRDGVFAHADWLELDRGTLDREHAIRRAAQRTGMAQSEIRRLLLAVPPSLTPIPETIELLYRLKARGYPLYCLSNMHIASIEHLEREQEFFEVFTGKVISCRLKLCKPEPAIYEQALKVNRLEAKDTVFIDDVDVNIEAAAKVGLHTIQFQNAAQCERELRALGVSL